ncbi:MAG TPA: ABC transporter substrate-binding protein [Actinomycetota bacterium]|nr:ABC transporter substrate-binding protein [Actinomycetota bacterium]
MRKAVGPGAVRGAVAVAALLTLVAAGCQGSEARARGSARVLRLGIFPNLTHAPGYVALGAGIFERVMGPTEVRITVFNSGSDAGTALLSGSIDATYIGPGPTAALWVRSGKVAVVSGATLGGASFVVRKGSGIRSPEDLHGKRIAVPGECNTQDVALRTWLHEQGLRTREEGGDVAVAVVDNPDLPGLFRSGGVDGAWEPEPYPSLLVAQGLATPFLDEADLWPGGRWVTTQLLVNTTYLGAHPEVVRRLVRANVEAIRMMNEDPERAKRVAQSQLALAGAPSLDQAVVDEAWSKLTFTWDPAAASQVEMARDAFGVGCLDEDPTDLEDLYRLDDLNGILRDMGEPEVEGP